tara:strand:- start:911 stop:1378 length:468 start_codon:yes stop_codon:yes gene_type:complete
MLKKFLHTIILLTAFGNEFALAENLPIEITANKMEWDKSKDQAIAEGNATASQGEKKITAKKIIASLDNTSKKQIKSLHALGEVRFTNSSEKATGKEAFYDLVAETITIEGEVTLKRNDNIMLGDKLVINFKTGLTELSGSQKKVRMKYNSSGKE